MSKKVIFHIGFGKTGTSSIQRMLFQQREKLKKLGVYYPDVDGHGIAQHYLARNNVESLDDYAVKTCKLIINKFNKSDCNVLLLSSEQFCFCRPSYIMQLAEVFGGIDSEILFYVRRQVSLIPSTFMQKVKMINDYSSGDFELFIKEHNKAFDFNLRIKPWVMAFGEGSISVRLYKEGVGFDVCKDFLQAIGVSDGISTDNTPRANTSLLPEFLDVIKVLDQHDVSSKCRQDVIKSLLGLSEQFRGTSRRSLLSEDVVSSIKNYYEDSNKVFSEKYISDANKSYLNRN